MRRSVLYAALAGGLLAPVPAPAESKQEVLEFLERYTKAYEARDMDALSGLIANSGEVVFYCPSIGDRWIGWPVVKAGLASDLRRLKSIQVEPQPATITVRGDIAWFARFQVITWSASGNEEVSTFMRWTGVVEKRGGSWVLVQSHFSEGAPRDPGPGD